MKMIHFKLLPTLLIIILALAACAPQKDKPEKEVITEKEESINYSFVPMVESEIDHVHGIGYPGNDTGLYVASHHGLKVFKENKWLESNTNFHDYMGFQAMKEGFIASGHPEEGSSLKNPLGLVTSSNNGASLNKLAFYGESDFHFLTSSFEDKTVYIINEEKNSILDPGVYFSQDLGKTWEASKLEEFGAETLGMMAAHPKEGEKMAMATKNGIYYSEDNGNTMKLLSEPIMTTALSFMGDDVIYAVADKEKLKVVKINPETKVSTDLNIPFLDYDNPITYLTVDHKNLNRIAFMTIKNDLYESKDDGKTWMQLLKFGKAE